jgi:hypothetical protein
MITIGCPRRIDPVTMDIDLAPAEHKIDHFLHPETVIRTTVEMNIVAIDNFHLFLQRIYCESFPGFIDQIENIMDMDCFHAIFFLLKSA